ncbi:hypothetical protein [Calothrix rhizosoleniae]|nr:hypothetical protein [Calothrix rhizosoleniae]
MDLISVIILTVVNILACLALPKLLSLALSLKQNLSLIPVDVRDTKTYQN